MSDKKKILIIQNIHQTGLQLIKNNPKYEFEITDDTNLDNLKKKIIDCDAISIRTAKLPSEVIEQGKKLKIISRHGVGYDNIDLNSSKKNNITITITATTNAIAVAEHVMFMLLNLAKRKSMYDETVRQGNFSDRNKLPKTIELWNKKILIAGFGRIGQSLIKRCKGFEMDVLVFDPFVEETVKEVDFISIHMPLNEKTKNLFNLSLMKTMKKNCIIINAARGGIINELDLNEALNKEIIFGAGLDVFEKEPPEKDNLLLKNPKVFLSPHTAAFTEECMIRMAKETIQNIIDFFEKKLEKNKIIII